MSTDALRRREEYERFRSVENVHDLPQIYEVWSSLYVEPKLASLGYKSIPDLWFSYVERARDRSGGAPIRMISLGAGNCDLEIDLASRIRAANLGDFAFECLEINPDMLERAKRNAGRRGVADHMHFHECDLNKWEADCAYDIVMAHHSLHHVVDLEHLLGQVSTSLGESGRFLVNDMIGRNGHMRWPEALLVVQLIWRSMPERYKYNHQLRRFEAEYDNWDCSKEGFEGVRSQDILPLLNETFAAELFFAFANVIDVFVDRGFGHNLDPALPEDVEFIREVGALDDATIDLGIVKPTHLVAVLGNDYNITARFHGHRSPEFCVRPPGADPPSPGLSGGERSSQTPGPFAGSGRSGSQGGRLSNVGADSVRRLRRLAGRVWRSLVRDRGHGS